MLRRRTLAVLVLVIAMSFAGVWPARADDRPLTSEVDVRALYDRLEPGMTLEQVAEAAKRPQLLTTREPVTSWLMWSRPLSPEGATVVVRVFFREARLARVEYEWFGEEYQRLIKGAELTLGLTGDAQRRLWQSAQAVQHCQEALTSYHRLLLGAQERLTPAEQQAWGRALELRRALESELGGLKQ